MTIMIGKLYSTAVANSMQFILKLPSPAMFITNLSGFPNFAPIEAPKPKPIVPNPPEDISVRGLVNL